MVYQKYRSAENHRQAKQFKRVIYISASPDSDDFTLLDDAGQDTSSDEKMMSDSSDESGVESVRVRLTILSMRVLLYSPTLKMSSPVYTRTSEQGIGDEGDINGSESVDFEHYFDSPGEHWGAC